MDIKSVILGIIIAYVGLMIVIQIMVLVQHMSKKKRYAREFFKTISKFKF